MPTPTAEARAAPSAVVSLIAGRSTGTSKRSACRWSIMVEFVMPPSTRKCSNLCEPSSFAMASNRSRV